MFLRGEAQIVYLPSARRDDVGVGVDIRWVLMVMEIVRDALEVRTGYKGGTVALVENSRNSTAQRGTLFENRVFVYLEPFWVNSGHYI